MNKPLIEACVGNLQSCINATKAGADRLELCGHLAIGGIADDDNKLHEKSLLFCNHRILAENCQEVTVIAGVLSTKWLLFRARSRII